MLVVPGVRWVDRIPTGPVLNTHKSTGRQDTDKRWQIGVVNIVRGPRKTSWLVEFSPEG